MMPLSWCRWCGLLLRAGATETCSEVCAERLAELRGRLPQ